MIRLNFGHRLFFFSILSSLSLLSTQSTYAASSVVQAPCSDSAQPGLKSCAEYLQTGTPKISASDSPTGREIPATPGLLTQLKDNISNQISAQAPARGYYQHVDPSYAGVDTSRFFGPTLCNLIPGEFTPAAETNKNRVGESCGNPVRIEINYSRRNILGCQTTSRPVPIIVNKEYNSRNPASSTGTLEDGYIRGSIVQATTCFYKQATNEIRDSRRLTISDINGSPSPCSSILTEFQTFSGQYKDSLANFKSQLGTQPNIADIVNCKKGWEQNLSSHPDVGKLRQSAQYLCTARASLETMFAHLAACEILARSQAGYLNVVASAASQRRFIEQLQNEVSNQCGDTCSRGISACNVPAASTVETCANNCYQSKMPGFFKHFIEGHWRSDGSKCDLSMNGEDNSSTRAARSNGDFSPLLMIGMLSLRGRRRRNLGAAKIRDSLLAIFGALALSGGGCSGGNTRVPPVCGTDGKPCETQPTFCETDPTNAVCSVNTPGDGGIQSHLAGAASAGTAASAALGAARQLNSPDTPAASTANHHLAQGEGATAGGIISDKPEAAPGLAHHSGGGPIAGANSDSPRGGASGGAASSTSTDLGGGLKTSDMSETQTAATALSGTQDSGGGQYKGGSGGASDSGNGGGAGAGLFGLNSGAAIPAPEGAAATSDETITPDMNGTTAQAAEGDPEDYFTRLDLHENLFKVVERRYRKTSSTWITGELKLLK